MLGLGLGLDARVGARASPIMYSSPVVQCLPVRAREFYERKTLSVPKGHQGIGYEWKHSLATAVVHHLCVGGGREGSVGGGRGGSVGGGRKGSEGGRNKDGGSEGRVGLK